MLTVTIAATSLHPLHKANPPVSRQELRNGFHLDRHAQYDRRLHMLMFSTYRSLISQELGYP